ncbi:MAG: site-specific integrase [bacterium]|nr:site-specific integrase [bacterium]
MGVHRRGASKVWQIEFQHRGQRIRRSSGTTIKADAQALEAQLRSELREGDIYGSLEELTLSEAFRRYYEARIKQTARKPNAQKVLAAIQRVQSDLGPDTPLADLTTPKLTKWRDGLRRADKADGTPGEPLAPASKNRYRDVLMATLRMAHEEWGALRTLPKLAKVKEGEQVTRFLTDEEETALLDAAQPHLKDLLVFLLDTGARKSEALQLEWDRVSLDRASPSVSFVSTKSQKPRGVPVPRRTEVLLRRLHGEASERAGGRELKGRVFLWQPPGTDSFVPFEDPKKGFRAARERAGLGADVTLHVMRHTYASRLVMAGVPLYDVSKLLGHSTVTMTERYAHLAPDHLERAVRRLDQR